MRDLYADRMAGEHIEIRTEFEESAAPGHLRPRRPPQPALQSGGQRDRCLPFRSLPGQGPSHRDPPLQTERRRLDRPRGRGRRGRHSGGPQQQGLPGLLLVQGNRGHGHRPAGGPEGRRRARRQGHLRIRPRRRARSSRSSSRTPTSNILRSLRFTRRRPPWPDIGNQPGQAAPINPSTFSRNTSRSMGFSTSASGCGRSSRSPKKSSSRVRPVSTTIGIAFVFSDVRRPR